MLIIENILKLMHTSLTPFEIIARRDYGTPVKRIKARLDAQNYDTIILGQVLLAMVVTIFLHESRYTLPLNGSYSTFFVRITLKGLKWFFSS